MQRSCAIIIILLLVCSWALGQTTYDSIAINPRCFDLSGYSESDPQKPPYLFDFINTVDPRSGVTSWQSGYRGDLTKGIAQKQFSQYYATHNAKYQNRGSEGYARFATDWVKISDANDVSKTYHFTNFYAQGGGGEAGDTLFIFSLDTIFSHARSDRERFLAYPFLYLGQPKAKITSTSSTTNWISVSVNFDARYLLFVWRLKNRGGYSSTPDYNSVIPYATPNYNTVTFPPKSEYYTGALPSKANANNTYQKFSGTNQGQGIDTLSLRYDHNVRTYWSKNYADTNTGPRIVTLRADYFPDIGPTQYEAFNRAGKRHWVANKDANAYIGGKLNVDSSSADPELRSSWDRDASLAFNISALYGSVAVSTSLTKWNSTPNGRGWMRYMEWGNEDMGNGATPLAFFCASSRAWDSIKAADPNMIVIMPGLVEPSYDEVITLQWLCEILRDDEVFVFDIINVHSYIRETDNLRYHPSLEEQVGASAASAREVRFPVRMDSMYRKMIAALNGDTSKHIILSEDGQGAWATAATTALEAGSVNYDIGNTPKFAGEDSATTRAKMLGKKDIIIHANTPFEFHNEFFFHNSDFSTTITNVLFQAYGRTTGRNITTFAPTVFYKWWYYRASIHNALGNYYPVAVITDTDSVFLAKYQKVGSDSVCYVRFKDTHNSGVIASQTLAFTGNVIGDVRKIVPSLTSEFGTASTKTVSSNAITDDINEDVQMYFALEGGGVEGEASPRRTIRKKSKTIRQ